MNRPKKVIYQGLVREVKNYRVTPKGPQVRIRTMSGLPTWVRLDRCLPVSALLSSKEAGVESPPA